MKVEVDLNVCQNYGQCVFVAPEVFDLDDNGELVYQSEFPDELEQKVRDAADACPVQAIKLLANTPSTGE